MALHVGSVLAERYEIVAPIASGGMGEVWQARDRTLGRIVAAKVLRSEYTSDPNFLIRFRNEARHTAALSHPNIASVYDYGETVTTDGPYPGQRVAYLVMEFVEGHPLVTVLAERGRLPTQQTLDVLRQAGDGLSAAHAAGMVHRDIKPGNLIVRPDGVVKLTDFGIARARDAAPLTRTGMVVGTAQYLSPEQAQGLPVTAASDVYSLGVLAYECLAGSRPFDGESQVAIALAQINRPPPPLPPDVPPPVRQLVERALAKDPADRFADGADFAAAVRTVAAGGWAPATAATQVVPGAGDPTTVLPAADPPTGGPRTMGPRSMGPRSMGPRTAPRTMPPLQGPATGEDDRYDRLHPDEPSPRSRPRWPWLVAGLALLLLLGAGAYVLTRGAGDAGRGTTATPSATTSSAPVTDAPPAAGVLVATDDYIGRPADEIEELLEGAGLDVVTEEASTALLGQLGVELGEGTVAGSNPANQEVPAESEVTLFVAEDGWPLEEPAEPPAPAPTTTTTRAPAPTTTRAPAPTTTRAPAPTTTEAPAPTTTEAPAPTTTEPPAPTTTAEGARFDEGDIP
ncbi:protein kinase domain-containing protein [Modestobacter lapidis]|nr:protein kinase [Modestobacter lapidis]